MNEKIIAQLIAELIEAQGIALGLLTNAVALQLDGKKLSSDVDRLIANARNQALPGGTEQLLTHMQRAAQAAAQHRGRH